MNIRLFYLINISAFTVTFISYCAFAQLPEKLKENFDKYQNSQKWSGGDFFNIDRSGGGNASISLDSIYSRNEKGKGVFIENPSKSETPGIFALTINRPLHNSIISFYVKRPEKSSGRVNFSIGSKLKPLCVFLMFNAGNISSFCGSDAENKSKTRNLKLGVMKINTWYKIQIQCDMITDKYRVWIDKQLKLPWTNFYHNWRLSNKEDKKISFGFRTEWGKAKLGIDDFSILPQKQQDHAKPSMNSNISQIISELKGKKGVYFFDFGTEKSETEKCFTKITPKTTYNEKLKYGWLDTKNLKAVGYGKKPGVITSLNADCVYSMSPATFNVELPPGDYCLLVTPNCPRVYIPAWRLKVDGISKINTVDLPDRTCTFKVDNKKVVNLEFEPHGAPFGTSFQIASMIIFPVSLLDQMSEVTEGLFEEAYFGDENIRKKYDRMSDKRSVIPVLSNKERKSGVLIFKCNDDQSVYPSYRPTVKEKVDNLCASAAGGEYAIFSFALYSLKDLPGLKLELPESFSDNNKKIPSADIDLRSIRYYTQPAKNKDGGFRKDLCGWGGGILEKREEVNLLKDRTQQYSMKVKIPENAVPGTYKANLKVTSQNGLKKTIPLKLNVYPFNLPDLNHEHYFFLWYLGAYRKPIKAYMKREIADMHEHGCNLFMIPDRFRGVKINKKPDGSLSYDFSKLKQNLGMFFEILDELHVSKSTPVIYPFPKNFLNKDLPEATGVSPWSKHIRKPFEKPINADYEKALKKFIRDIEELRKKMGWPELLYYPIDEPYSTEKSKLAWTLLKTIKDAAKVRTFCTLPLPGHYFKPLEPLIDVRTYNGGNAFKDAPRLVEKAKKDSAVCWYYGMHYDKKKWNIENHARFRWGFAALKMGCKGNGFWIYEWSKKNFFNRVSGLNGLIYPLAEGPATGLRWENFRRGTEDYKYYFLLKNLIKQYKKSNPDTVASAEEEIKKIIAEISPEITPTINEQVMNKWRSRLLFWILKFKKLHKGENQ